MRANESGSNLESTITELARRILVPKGYVVTPQYSFGKKDFRNVPLFSDSCRADVLIRGIRRYESGLILSAKRQVTTGSVDEKLYYHVDFIVKRVYPFPTILVMTGNGWNNKIKMWVRSEIDRVWLLDAFFDIEMLTRWMEQLPQVDQEAKVLQWVNLPLFDELPEYGGY